MALRRGGGLSRGFRAVCAATLVVVAVLAGAAAHAHNLAYAVVTARPSADRSLVVEVQCHVPALLMGAPQGHLDDVRLPRFLAYSDAEIAARSETAGQAFLGSFSLRADGRLLDAVSVSFPDPAQLRADAAVPRTSPRPSAPMVLSARLPEGATTFDVALPPQLGPAVVIVRYPDGRTATEALPDGERTRTLRFDGPSPLRDGAEAFGRFLLMGVGHILPLGLDHVAFIVALTLGAAGLRRLVVLATTFTVAHSITLALAAFRLVEVPSLLIEPVIALSIVAVALLAVLRPRAGPDLGLPLAFGFGLVHGLGFAGALSDVGLPRGQEALALAGFNVGVELGQVAVILGVFGLLAAWRSRPFYHSRIVTPASLAIAALGLVWTVQRLGAALGAPAFGGA